MLLLLLVVYSPMSQLHFRRFTVVITRIHGRLEADICTCRYLSRQLPGVAAMECVAVYGHT